MMPLRLLPAKLRALAWGVRAAMAARRQLAAGGLDALDLPAAPDLPYEAKAGVVAALRVVSRNCLVRSSVRQAWYAAHGREADLIIGVTGPSSGFKAHAWLSSDPPAEGEGYAEIARRPVATADR